MIDALIYLFIFSSFCSFFCVVEFLFHSIFALCSAVHIDNVCLWLVIVVFFSHFFLISNDSGYHFVFLHNFYENHIYVHAQHHSLCCKSTFFSLIFHIIFTFFLVLVRNIFGFVSWHQHKWAKECIIKCSLFKCEITSFLEWHKECETESGEVHRPEFIPFLFFWSYF